MFSCLCWDLTHFSQSFFFLNKTQNKKINWLISLFFILQVLSVHRRVQYDSVLSLFSSLRGSFLGGSYSSPTSFRKGVDKLQPAPGPNLAHSLVLEIKIYWHTVCSFICILSMTAFMQNQGIVTEVSNYLFIKPELFIIWLFTKNIYANLDLHAWKTLVLK